MCQYVGHRRSTESKSFQISALVKSATGRRKISPLFSSLRFLPSPRRSLKRLKSWAPIYTPTNPSLDLSLSHHLQLPWTVAKTLLCCFPLRNSRNQIPCQVPRASLPSEIGMLTEAPMREDLMWAGISSLPSASWR